MVIPRTEAQAERIRARRAANLIVPERAIDAQSLIAFADLVVSAGGTMNREAVALGNAGVHDLQRPDGRGGRAADRRGAAASRSAIPASSSWSSARPGRAPRAPRDPDLLVDGILGAVGTGR